MKLFAGTLIILGVGASLSCFAAMDSSNYSIWIDSWNTGSGEASSSTYSINQTIGEQAIGDSSSSSYTQKSGTQTIDGEPTVGLNVTATPIDFGLMTTNNTSIGYSVFTAFTNAPNGYTIRIYGNPPTLTEDPSYDIDPIGAISDISEQGTEQFGINLVANTDPEIGAVPNGGIGVASTAYGIANEFAYVNGAIIAESTGPSQETTYTASYIANISDDTIGGTYTTTITFSIIANF